MRVTHSATLSSSIDRWKGILLLHFVICSVGLIKIAMLGAGNFYDAKLTEFAISQLGLTGLHAGPNKLGRFLEYFFSLGLLIVFYSVALWTVTRQKVNSHPILFSTLAIFENQPTACHPERSEGSFDYISSDSSSKKRSQDDSTSKQFSKIARIGLFTPVFLLLYFLVNCCFTYRLAHHGIPLNYSVPMWFLATFALPLNYLGWSIHDLPKIPTKLAWFFVTALVCQLFLIFQPLITQPFLIANDYMDIPGETRLQSGKWVDNTTYINEHNIGGIIKYDPRIDHGKTPSPRANSFVPIIDDSLLTTFLSANIDNVNYRLTYSPETHLLSVNGILSENDLQNLKHAVPNTIDKQQIDKLYILALQQKHFYENRVYTPEEWDFIHKNKMELKDQTRIGWFFYHHNYFFGSIYHAAHSTHDVPIMVYGWFSTVLFAKLLPYLGGINYQTYFKLLFSFYPLYYLCFLFAIFCVFRRIEYLLLGMLLGLTGIFQLGTQVLLLGIGLNPLRHFLDVFSLLTFYFFIKQKKLFWLTVSYAFAVTAVLINKEFGIFLLGAISLASFIHTFHYPETRIATFLISGLAISTGIYLYFFATPGANPTASYMLLGIGSAETPAKLVKFLLICSSLLYVTIIQFRVVDSPVRYFFGATLVYCQFLMIYFLWYPEAHHFVSLAVPLSLLVLSFIYLSIRYLQWRVSDQQSSHASVLCHPERSEGSFNKQAILHYVQDDKARWDDNNTDSITFERREARILFGICLLTFIFLYLPKAIYFYDDQRQYHTNFQNHRLYEWPFKTAKLTSTINPELFSHSVNLIQKYASTTDIYLISKYESILPILAEKYNAMPYPELLTNLITINDIAHVSQLINEKKPKYLFVDTDIARSYNKEVYEENDPMVQKFKLYDLNRAPALERFKKVFNEVKKDYLPIENSELITVYKRISS